MAFERFYGFIGGVTDQYGPELVQDNGFIEPPASPRRRDEWGVSYVVVDDKDCDSFAPVVAHFANAQDGAP